MNIFIIDIYSVIVLLAIGNFTSLLILMAYKSGSARQSSYRMFMVGKVLQAFGWLLLSFRGWAPEFLTVYLGNTVLISGIALEALAFVSAKEANPRSNKLFAILGFTGILLFWVFAGTPSLRVSLASLAATALFGTAAVMMIRHWERSRLRLTLGLYFATLCLVLALRTSIPMIRPDGFSLMAPNLVQTLTFLPLFLLMLGSGIGFILLIKEQDDQRIRESELKFATVFRSSPNAIILTRLSDGTVLEVNERFESFTGYSALEAVGKTTTELRLPDRPETREEVVRSLLAEGRIVAQELELKDRQGKSFTGLISAEVITLQGEQVILAAIADITQRKQLEREREHLIENLQGAFSEVQALSGLLPICASCKKIRDDTGYWNQIEDYISRHSEAEFTHGICPDCAKEFFPVRHKKPQA